MHLFVSTHFPPNCSGHSTSCLCAVHTPVALGSLAHPPPTGSLPCLGVMRPIAQRRAAQLLISVAVGFPVTSAPGLQEQCSSMRREQGEKGTETMWRDTGRQRSQGAVWRITSVSVCSALPTSRATSLGLWVGESTRGGAGRQRADAAARSTGWAPLPVAAQSRASH